MSKHQITIARRRLLCVVAGAGAVVFVRGAEAQLNTTRIYVGDGRARAAVSGAPKASVFLTIYNSTEMDDVLLGATCSWAEKVVFLRTVWKGLEHREVAVKQVDVPAASTVSFRPGGIEIHLVKPTRALTPGLKVPLDLRFQNIGTLHTEVEVFNRLL